MTQIFLIFIIYFIFSSNHLIQNDDDDPEYLAAIAASLMNQEPFDEKMQTDLIQNRNDENLDIYHYFAKILSELPETIMIEMPGN